MSPDTILSVHNYYQQPGGEDQVFAAEASLLEQYGHRVVRYTAHNDHVAGMNRLELAHTTVWNNTTQRELLACIQREKPQIVHLHNTFVMISPAAYYTCKDAGLPVVQTLHNYRLVCPDALLLREKGICNDCLGKTIPWPGVLHACYHNSRLQTATIAAMLAFHRWRKTWHKQVDIYIALSEFARQKFIVGGLPADRIMVKPNFLHPDPGPKTTEGDYALFVGRFSPEKGIPTMLRAWASGLNIPLKIAGDGPLMPEVVAKVQDYGLQHVDILGRLPHNDIVALLKNARFLVFPSECYENFSVTLVEAFACGVPVLAARLGSTAEIVEDGRTGKLFIPGSPDDLAAQANWLWSHAGETAQMSQEARTEYLAKYTAQQNYQRLVEIYNAAKRVL